MKIVLDTNILLAIAPKPSAYYWVFEALREGRFSLIVSTDILDEYAELLERWYGVAFADAVLAECITLPNVQTTSPAYFWHIIEADHDDDKFIDAYLSGNAHLLVSNDGHFKALFNQAFPRINWTLFADFIAYLEGGPLVLQKPKGKSARRTG